MVAAAAFLVDRSEEARHRDRERAAVVEAASARRALLEAQLNRRLHLVKGLSALARLHPDITPAQFQPFAAALVSDIAGIRSVQLAPGAVVSHLWPLAGNEQALGHDLFADPERREMTRRTIDAHRLVVTGPHPLLQGGVGMVAREPVFLGTPPADRFWGLSTIVIDLEQLLKSAGFEPRDDVRFALRGRDGLGAAGQVFHGEAALFGGDPVVMEITLPNGSWQLAAVPGGGWSPSRPGRAWFVALAVALAAAAAVMTFRLMRATGAARDNERRFRSLFDQSLQGLAVISPDGVVLDVNDTLCAQLGDTRGGLVGRPLWAAAWWSTRPERAALLQARLAGVADGGAARFEVVDPEPAEGAPEALDVAVKPLMSGDRTMGQLLVETRDTSERHRAEQSMARNLAVNVVLGRILRLSLEDVPLETVLDAALGELLDLPWLRIEPRAAIFVFDAQRRDLRMAASRNLPPELVTGCARVALGRCLCGQAALSGMPVFAADVDHRHENTFEGMADHGHFCLPIGSKADLLGVLTTYVRAGHRRLPEQEAFLELVADTLGGIIKRKRVEQHLRDSEELAKALINATDDAACLLDRNGVLLAANEAFAWHFGSEPAGLVGRSFFALLPPELAASRRAQFDEVVGERKALIVHDERDGRALDNCIYPVLDAQGAVAGVAVFSRDVTQAREAAARVDAALAELARSNAELEQFAYIASHDLRQPLRMVSSYLTLIDKRLAASADTQLTDFLRYAVDGAKRMDRLILDLLEYSRSGRGSAFEPMPLAEVVAEAASNLEVAIAESGAELSVAELPVVMGDRGELVRLFQNLIGNAVKYRRADCPPRVELGARRDGRRWLVWVRDNGIGIAPADHERAFGIFQRVGDSQHFEGTGIGLAICRKIVENHGGRIWIDSGQGEGTTFLMTLPPS